jgi:hypothetical protein
VVSLKNRVVFTGFVKHDSNLRLVDGCGTAGMSIGEIFFSILFFINI